MNLCRARARGRGEAVQGTHHADSTVSTVENAQHVPTLPWSCRAARRPPVHARPTRHACARAGSAPTRTAVTAPLSRQSNCAGSGEDAASGSATCARPTGSSPTATTAQAQAHPGVHGRAPPRHEPRGGELGRREVRELGQPDGRAVQRTWSAARPFRQHAQPSRCRAPPRWASTNAALSANAASRRVSSSAEPARRCARRRARLRTHARGPPRARRYRRTCRTQPSTSTTAQQAQRRGSRRHPPPPPLPQQGGPPPTLPSTQGRSPRIRGPAATR